MTIASQDVKLDMNYTLTQKREVQILGISITNWGIILAIFAVLYFGLGLIFWGFLSAAQNLRQEEWLTLPPRSFGDFDTTNQFLENWNSRDSQIGYTIEDILNYEEDGKIAEFNRPDGCKAKKISESEEFTRTFFFQPEQRVLTCDDGVSEAYTLFPWVVDLQSQGNSNAVYAQGCGDRNTEGTPANGRFTQEDFLTFLNLKTLTANDVKFACMNVLPKAAFAP
eukprot:TRINITY_DN1770_c1_g1_i2.p2 TRINITY_DN1770_c1_g1~~TRINITY_DN1770_c1_g1_i2.p2  ORF type:complete len:224 (-),score=31.09 TRINITY_DN1770_c1_g1_i2:159-830(-)